MTPGSIAALFATLALLAAVPSVSTLTVVARAAAHGYRHGVCTAAGIVVADLLFILIAIYGLAALATNQSGLFVVMQYLGGAYLLWSGIALLRSAGITGHAADTSEHSLWSSFMAGLLITLGDQKAILFYLGFLPAFINLAALTVLDTGIILLVTIVAVGGVKLVYAWLAGRGGARLDPRVYQVVTRLAACTMLVVGLFVIVRA